MDPLTPKEKENILVVAEALIKEPDSWVRGQWKCPAYKANRDRKGRFISGKRERKTDQNGTPLYNYCIEGAVNEAAVRVLGKERAEYYGVQAETGQGSYLANALDLNLIAHEMHGHEWAMSYNDNENSTHDGVLRILRSGLERVRNLGKGKKS